MASSVPYDDEELNEQTWLYYVNEKTKHLKFNIEEWLNSDINEFSKAHVFKNENLETDTVTKKTRNIQMPIQKLMNMSDPKDVLDVEEIKMKSDVSHKMKPCIAGSVDLEQLCNFEMDGLDVNRTLLEDVKLSFDNSLEYCCSNSLNGKKENELLGFSPILAEKEILFFPKNISTPEVEIQKHTKNKKINLQKKDNHIQKLQNKLSLERLNDQINEERCQLLNDTFLVSEDVSIEGKEDLALQSHCSVVADKTFNASEKSEKVLPVETGIQRLGKTKKVHPPMPIHRPRELSRKQSLERLSDITNEGNEALNTTFRISGSGDVLDKEDLQMENAENISKLDSKVPTEIPLLNSSLGDKGKSSQGLEIHIQDSNETFIQEVPDHNRASNKHKTVENNDKFLLTSALRNKQGSCPNLGNLNMHENYNTAQNALLSKAGTSGTVNEIESVSVGPGASAIHKKIPKKLGSRLPLPVNRGALLRTSRIPLPKSDQIE